MATIIYLIRHGETVDSDSRRYKGHIDVPLSDNGIAQVRKLSGYLSQNTERRTQNTDIKAVYCSGLSRAVKSAEIISESFSLDPIIDNGLKERNFGVWEGMSFDEIREKWPDAFNAWAENPVKFSPIKGESTLDVRDRAMEAFNTIVSNHTGDSIAIVAHGGINRVILCELLGIPLKNIFRIEQDFTAMNEIELWDYPVIKRFNYVVQI
jgi:alpha-ribazole phosphatase/probable phosphoglycerate mutase